MERLNEANTCTWNFPEFKIEFARRVRDANAKEMILHRYFKEDRVSPRREFFRITEVERLKLMFELMDGDWWDADREEEPAILETPQGKKAGEVVIRQFLDEHIYPPDKINPVPVPRARIERAFAEWKRAGGYYYGNVKDLIDTIRNAKDHAGNPLYGEPGPRGWTGFSLRE